MYLIQVNTCPWNDFTIKLKTISFLPMNILRLALLRKLLLNASTKHVCEQFPSPLIFFFFFLKPTRHLKAHLTELLFAFADKAI